MACRWRIHAFRQPFLAFLPMTVLFQTTSQTKLSSYEYTWNERKRVSNLAKHRIDFTDMYSFNWDIATIVPDDEYGDRLIATSYIDFRVCVAVYTDQESGKIRIISLRRATKEEIRRYAET